MHRGLIKDIAVAIRKTLFDYRSLGVVVLASVAVFALLFLVPVWTTPGNSIAFEWSLLKPVTLFLLVLLSLTNGLVLGMHAYIKKHRPEAAKGGYAKKATTFLGMIGSSIAATVACAACYSSLLSLVGLGGTAFVVTHKWWFVAFALCLAFLAMHFAAKKIAGGCKACDAGACPMPNKS